MDSMSRFRLMFCAIPCSVRKGLPVVLSRALCEGDPLSETSPGPRNIGHCVSTDSRSAEPGCNSTAGARDALIAPVRGWKSVQLKGPALKRGLFTCANFQLLCETTGASRTPAVPLLTACVSCGSSRGAAGADGGATRTPRERGAAEH
jgi:hypothetical protein